MATVWQGETMTGDTATKGPEHSEAIRALPDIEAGWFHAIFMYDVADSIDMGRLAAMPGLPFSASQLELKPAPSPGHGQFLVPPMAGSLPDISANGFTATTRAMIHSYGVVSLRLSVPFQGSWSDYACMTRDLKGSHELAAAAGRMLDDLCGQIGPALVDPHEKMVEDYFVFQVEACKEPLDSTVLLSEHAAAVSALIAGESRCLSKLEQDEILRVRFSYFPEDLAVIEWDSAFIFDRAECAEAVIKIIEFANSQLVELRTYDARLDAELDAIYRLNVDHKKPERWGRREADRRARQLGRLLVDVRELADRAGNSLKITGDAYYARVYRGVLVRLGMADWQHQIDQKLRDMGEMYHFLTDEAHHAQGEYLELIVILLIMVEVIIGITALVFEIVF